MNIKNSLLICIVFFVSTLVSSAQVPESVVLEELVTGLEQPVAGTHAGDGSGRLFLVEQKGRILIYQDGQLLEQPFLDIQNRVVSLNQFFDERGLLGLAFHPDYETNGRFFVYYSADGGGPGAHHQSVIAEFQVSADDPNVAVNEERRLLTFDQPEFNHNGGQLAFGPDGMLYIGTGDGGGGGDMHGTIGNGQDLTTLLGKMLRIDVDGAEPYAIPDDNPFLDTEARDEIWAYGLRNPWRFSFDRGGNNDLFCADVGQSSREEINIITRGGNYGWRITEGTLCFNPSSNCDTTDIIFPVAEYGRNLGVSVTGGFVYRGSEFSSLVGRYVFADFSNRFFLLDQSAPGEWELHTVPATDASGRSVTRQYSSFVQGEDGELYVLYTRGSNFFSDPGEMARVTVPGDEPVPVCDWFLHEPTSGSSSQ